MSFESGPIDYKNNLLHKHADEFLKSFTESDVNEYFRTASSIITEFEQAKRDGQVPPLDPATIKLVRTNRSAVAKIRDSFIFQKYSQNLLTKNLDEFTAGLSIHDFEKYIEIATITIDKYKKDKAEGTLPLTAPKEKDIEALSLKKEGLIKLRKEAIARSPARAAHELEEAATSILKSFELFQEPGAWYFKPSESLYEPSTVFEQAQKAIKSYEKAALEFERVGDQENAWRVRSLAARAVQFSSKHPLYEMRDSIRSRVEKNTDLATGAHVSFLDTSTMKEGSASFSRRLVEEPPIPGKPGVGTDKTAILTASFDINVPARKSLQPKIDAIQRDPFAFLEQIPIGFCTDITVKAVHHFYRQRGPDGVYSLTKGFNGGQDDTAIEIEFHGVGKITIGNNPKWGCHYNHVTIECPDTVGKDQGKNLLKMEQMLTLIGMPLTFTEQLPEDQERSKLTSLFHIYYPKESAKLEQTEGFYTMPLKDLQRLIFTKIPLTDHKKFESHLKKMELREALPGQFFWTVPDLTEDLGKNGMWYLMAGMGGGLNDDNAFQSGMQRGVKYLLSSGFIPTTEKYRAGYSSSAGASPGSDLREGGGNGVFTRAITEPLSRDYHTTDPTRFNGLITQFPFSGGVQAIIDPKQVIDSSTLFYNHDSYGVDNPESNRYETYEKRKDPASFVRSLDTDCSDNEVILRGTIPPKAVLGLVVQTDARKRELIEFLKTEGFAKLEKGKYMINGKEVDRFVHVAERFTRDMAA
jgi:hypothetical protein